MKTEEEKRQPEGRPDADYNREEFLEKILKHRIACFESLDTPAWDHISETAQALAETGGGFIILGVKENDGTVKGIPGAEEQLRDKDEFFTRLRVEKKLIRTFPGDSLPRGIFPTIIIMTIPPTEKTKENEIYQQLYPRIERIESAKDLDAFFNGKRQATRVMAIHGREYSYTIVNKPNSFTCVLSPQPTTEEKLQAKEEELRAKEEELKKLEYRLKDRSRYELRSLLAQYGISFLFHQIERNQWMGSSTTKYVNSFIDYAAREGYACFDNVFTLDCAETICQVACTLANHHREGHIYYGYYRSPSLFRRKHFYDRFSTYITLFIGGLLQDACLFTPAPLEPKAEIITTQSGDIIHFTIPGDGRNNHEYRGRKEWGMVFSKALTLPSLEEVQKKIDDEKPEIISVDLTPANTPVEKPATDSSTDAPEQEGSFDYDKLKKEVKDNDNFKKALEFLSSEKEEEKPVFIHEKKTYAFNVDWITGEDFKNAVNRFLNKELKKPDGIYELIKKYNKENNTDEGPQIPRQISKQRNKDGHIAEPLKFALWLGIFAWVGDKNRSECSEKEGSKNDDNTPWLSQNDILKKNPTKTKMIIWKM